MPLYRTLTELLKIFKTLTEDKINCPSFAGTPFIVAYLDCLEIRIADNFNSTMGLLITVLLELLGGLVGSFKAAKAERLDSKQKMQIKARL